MAEEFVIKSETLEDTINRLLPSQGGQGAGVDLSASSMIIPIVDVTESAEGSGQRQDLQSAFTLKNTTAFSVTNTTKTIITTTGFWRIYGTSSVKVSTGGVNAKIILTDGLSSRDVFKHFYGTAASDNIQTLLFDFIVKLEAGDSLNMQTTNSNAYLEGVVRQIADLSGNLITP